MEQFGLIWCTLIFYCKCEAIYIDVSLFNYLEGKKKRKEKNLYTSSLICTVSCQQSCHDVNVYILCGKSGNRHYVFSSLSCGYCQLLSLYLVFCCG